MSKRTIGMGGFTLAEVLITLGIIGVVAAMTMPTLINSTNGAQYKTAYKKALSVMSQAVAMNIALNDYDLSETAGTGSNGTEAEMDAQAQSLYSIFKNRMNVVKVRNGNDFNTTAGHVNQYLIVTAGDTEDYTTFAENHTTNTEHAFPAVADAGKFGEDATLLFMNDGITLIFDNTQFNCIDGTATNNLSDEWCFGFIDVNGQKGPNRIIKCDNGSEDTANGAEGTDGYACTVTNPTDIYPIAFYNQSVIPASGAARAVLYSK
ncbi:type II secretion system protein [bacterium]|nr:type II secretion system protein [bacterium]